MPSTVDAPERPTRDAKGHWLPGFRAGPGRAKGSITADTAQAREALHAAYEQAGGIKKLAALIDSDDPSDRKTFWTLWGRAFVPQRVDADVNVNSTHAEITALATLLPEPLVAIASAWVHLEPAVKVKAIADLERVLAEIESVPKIIDVAPTGGAA